MIPTGAIAPVRGTPLDFTTATPIGARINQLKGDPVGYDHNYVLRGAPDAGKTPRLAARVHEPASGRVLEVLTTEPAVQLYTGNFLDGTLKGKGGVVYQKHQAFCLETQHYPDSVHHPRLPVDDPPAGFDVYPDDDLQVLGAMTAGPSRELESYVAAAFRLPRFSFLDILLDLDHGDG